MVEEFWNDLSVCVESLKRKISVVVLDLNVRVSDEVMEGICKRYGVVGRDESGELLYNMCSEHD